MTADHKTCGQCGKRKPVECFSRNRTAPDGLQHACKACARVNYLDFRANQTFEEHEARKARQRAWNAANKDKIKAANDRRALRRKQDGGA